MNGLCPFLGYDALSGLRDDLALKGRDQQARRQNPSLIMKFKKINL
jgi:hypothetical protein